MRGAILALVVLSIVISGCVDPDAHEPVQPTPDQGQGQPEPVQEARLETEPIDLSSTTTDAMDFARHYSLQPLSIDLDVPEYDLPLQTDQISNYDSFSEKIQLSNLSLIHI